MSDIEVRLSPRLMQGFPVGLAMAEPVLSFRSVQHRHAVPAPRLTKPWAKREGPGVVGVSLDLHEGAVLGLIGPNGAGKTTLLRLMAGILPLQAGEIMSRFEGSNWTHVEDLRTFVGHMPEQVRWQGRSTVVEALTQLGDMRGTSPKNIERLLALVGLRPRRDEPLDNLSQGMRQRLSIAAALLGSPKVLLLDEPFNGLDPVAAQAFASLVRTLASKGVSVVISSHMVAQLEGLIDRIALLHRGQLLDEGPLDDVEHRLGLNGRYAITGTGEVDPNVLVPEEDILTFERDDGRWTLTVNGPSTAALEAAKSNGVDLTSWAPVRPNLVEWLCAATGMSVDDISLEVASSALLPMQPLEVREDE
ncbi:MAG: hypothetical protein CMA80_01135 [Euryarchaeota archaeon]|nr:hypothetical protein [Euryarchaeota archaeon]